MSKEARTLIKLLDNVDVALDPRVQALLEASPVLQKSLVSAFGDGGVDEVVRRTSAWLQFA